MSEKRRKKRDKDNDSSAEAAFNVPLENQLVIKYNKTLVVNMLEWKKALVSPGFDLSIELCLKQKMKHNRINCFEAVVAIVSPKQNTLFCLGDVFVVLTSPKHDLKIGPGEFCVTRNFSRNGLEHLRRVS